MTYAIGRGWRMMPGREGVTLLVRKHAGARSVPAIAGAAVPWGASAPYVDPVYDGEAVSEAWHRPVSVDEQAASQGKYIASDVKWYLPKELRAARPLPGDIIVPDSGPDEGQEYTVLETSEAGGLTVWELTTRNLVLAHQMTDSIDIERPTFEDDAAGVPIPKFKVVIAGLRCAVQLEDQQRAEDRGIEGFQSTYSIYLSRQIGFTGYERIRLDGGRYLDITNYRNPERIDELPQLTAVEKL